MKIVTLTVEVDPDQETDALTDALGETLRTLEVETTLVLDWSIDTDAA